MWPDVYFNSKYNRIEAKNKNCNPSPNYFEEVRNI